MSGVAATYPSENELRALLVIRDGPGLTVQTEADARRYAFMAWRLTGMRIRVIRLYGALPQGAGGFRVQRDEAEAPHTNLFTISGPVKAREPRLYLDPRPGDRVWFWHMNGVQEGRVVTAVNDPMSDGTPAWRVTYSHRASTLNWEHDQGCDGHMPVFLPA